MKFNNASLLQRVKQYTLWLASEVEKIGFYALGTGLISLTGSKGKPRAFAEKPI